MMATTASSKMILARVEKRPRRPRLERERGGPELVGPEPAGPELGAPEPADPDLADSEPGDPEPGEVCPGLEAGRSPEGFDPVMVTFA